MSASDELLTALLPVVASRRDEGGADMEKTMKLRCAGYWPNVTTRDHLRSAGVMIGVTLVLTLAWMGLHFRFPDDPYVESLGFMPFFAGMAFAAPLTYLKGRSRASQAACMGLMLAAITGIFLVAGFVASKI